MFWIRLARFGCQNRPLYRVITVDSRFSRDEGLMEVLGHFNPFAGEKAVDKLVLNLKKLEYWISSGARATDQLKSVLIRCGIVDTFPVACSATNEGPRAQFSVKSVSPWLGPSSHMQGVHTIFSRKFSGVPDQGETSTDKPFVSDKLGAEVQDEKTCEIASGNVPWLMAKIDHALSELRRKLDKPMLKRRFDREFRPHLSATCLLLPHGLRSKSTEFIHKQHQRMHRRIPEYLSSYELMIQRERIDDDAEWRRFWNQLINSRVFISEEWDSNIGNVETLHYDYGITGFCKGEVDASYHDGEKGKPGKATISIIIWQDGKVICSEVYKDVICDSIHIAEAYAVLALFFKCFELKIEHLVLWTDNSDIQGSVTGSYTVNQSRDAKVRDVLILLGCMAKRFTQLIAMCKPRELLFLADEIAQDSASIPNMESALKKFEYQLSRKAVFKLSLAGSVKAIVNKFEYKTYGRKEQTECFLLVDYLDKIEAVAQLKEALRPSEVCIAIHCSDEKSEDFRTRVKELLGPNLDQGILLKNEYKILHHTTKYDGGKRLLIVTDGSLSEYNYDFLDCFTVILVSSTERKLLDPSIEEISALSYCYFNGVQ